MGKQLYVDSTISDPYTQGQLCLSGSKNQHVVKTVATTLTWNTRRATAILDYWVASQSLVPACAVMALQ